ncbi:Acyl-CoA dehydrogenase family member 9 [Blattella germanica]|nr:Acyl-CoA dehydrogenase family member 9 [Blattella germanica]
MIFSKEVLKSVTIRQIPRKILRPYLSILNTQICRGTASQKAVATDSENSEMSAVKKPPQTFPFAKNLFLGKFDYNVLTYPEVLSKEQLQTLNEMVDPIEKFFSEVDSKKIDAEAQISKEVLDQLKSLGLFGQQIPEEYGGLGLTATEFCRLGEIISLDGSIAVTLNAHQSIGLKGLLLAGNEEQKQRYLSRLASGELIAAFCLTEAGSGSDAGSIQTRATLSEDKKHWILNGTKIWISNGGIADFFTVFARTEIEDHKGEKRDAITAFIVERNFGGISNGKPEDKLGIKGSNTCSVMFEDTPVPVENVLGNVGEGFKLALTILNSGRFSMGSASAGILKKMLKMVTEHVNTRKQFGKPLAEFELIQEKIAKLTILTYVMESMTYLTSGMLDTYENPDCSVEAAIVKVFSSEGLWYAISECIQILGGQGYMKDCPFERYLRDARILMIFEGTNEILRMLIALIGIQHAGTELREVVNKLRNPLMNPNFIIKKVWQTRQQSNDNPTLNLGLDGYLHPSLQPAAKILEYCILRLQYGVEVALQRHGKLIVDKQLTLKRLADSVIDIYAMTAVLGRASRSHCIGLQDSPEEMLIAATFCQEAHGRVKKNILEIEQATLNNTDESYKKLAEQICKRHGYFPVHPLTRNY